MLPLPEHAIYFSSHPSITNEWVWTHPSSEQLEKKKENNVGLHSFCFHLNPSKTILIFPFVKEA